MFLIYWICELSGQRGRLWSSKPAVCLTWATKAYPRAPTTKPISFFRNSCSRTLSRVITAMVRTMPHENETFLLKISKSYLLMSGKIIILTSVYSCWLLCFKMMRGGKSRLLYGLWIIAKGLQLQEVYCIWLFLFGKGPGWLSEPGLSLIAWQIGEERSLHCKLSKE